MVKRLFIAIPLPDNIKIELAQYKKYFNFPNLRWVLEENWHITVLFLGDVEGSQIIDCRFKILELAKNISPFELKLQDIAVAPPGRNPRMVWAVFRYQDEFERLVKKVREALKDLLPIDYSHQEQIAHVTLARFPFWRGGRQQAPEVKPVSFEANEIWLMESELKPEGAKYKVVEIFNF